jgi:hypothetical protein
MSTTQFTHRLTAIACLAIALASLTCAAYAAPPPESAARSQTTSRHQVTLLGVNRGYSFLATDDPVSDGDREPGPHQVEWIQIKLLVENRDAGNRPYWYQWELRTPEGAEITSPRTAGGVRLRTSSAIEADLNDARLPGLLYPVAIPQAIAGKHFRVLILGMSGRLRRSAQAELIFSIGETEDDAERLRFKLALPY